MSARGVDCSADFYTGSSIPLPARATRAAIELSAIPYRQARFAPSPFLAPAIAGPAHDAFPKNQTNLFAFVTPRHRELSPVKPKVTARKNPDEPVRRRHLTCPKNPPQEGIAPRAFLSLSYTFLPETRLPCTHPYSVTIPPSRSILTCPPHRTGRVTPPPGTRAKGKASSRECPRNKYRNPVTNLTMDHDRPTLLVLATHGSCPSHILGAHNTDYTSGV